MQLTHDIARRALAPTIVAALFYFGAIEPANAYPQFQFSTYNATCNVCHFSVVGGGLVNSYGRDESSSTISHTEGDGGFLHGLWTLPDWFQVGGDYRSALIVKQNYDEPQVLFFPMQVDLYTRAAFKSVSFTLITGVRGTARTPRRPVIERIVSREHFLTWQSEDSGRYVRVGRFFAPFGLRLPDHTAYVRRYLGQHTLEETYNISVGKVSDGWEGHATVFTPSPLFPIGARATGGALYYERRAREDTASYAAQTRVAITSDDMQYWLGGIGKLWLDGPKLLFLSELDIGLQTFRFDGADARAQLIAYLGVTYFLRQGVMLGSAIEHYDADLTLTGSERDSINLTVQYFPRSHFEIMLLGKLETQSFNAPDSQLMLMLHYYL